GRGARDRSERLAGRRVARSGTAPARLDRRAVRVRGPGRRRDRAARTRPSLHPGAVPRPPPRADGATALLADLRGVRAARPAGRLPRLLLGWQPDHGRGLAVLLLRGPRRPAAGDGGPRDQPRGRGRLRALPVPAGGVGGARLRLAARAAGAPRRGLEPPAQ